MNRIRSYRELSLDQVEFADSPCLRVSAFDASQVPIEEFSKRLRRGPKEVIGGRSTLFEVDIRSYTRIYWLY